MTRDDRSCLACQRGRHRLDHRRRTKRDRTHRPTGQRDQTFPLPKERRNANLNSATFYRQGVLWFTGQNGVSGSLDPKTGEIAVFDAPRGTGPYGIFGVTAASDCGSPARTAATSSPMPARPRVRRTGICQAIGPQHHALYVDETDAVWLSDWSTNAILRFDPKTKNSHPFRYRIAMPRAAARGPQGRNVRCRVRRQTVSPGSRVEEGRWIPVSRRHEDRQPPGAGMRRPEPTAGR